MKATCTWGDGPDVMLSLGGHTMVLHEDPRDKDAWVHGTISDGSADLTADEARELASQLLMAADQADHLEDSFGEYCKSIRELTKDMEKNGRL